LLLNLYYLEISRRLAREHDNVPLERVELASPVVVALFDNLLVGRDVDAAPVGVGVPEAQQSKLGAHCLA